MAFAALLPFLPALSGKALDIDDDWYVFDNADVMRGLSAESFRWALTSLDLGYWFPATLMSHLVDVSMWGDYVPGHHLTSLLLHVATAAVLYFVLEKATSERFAAVGGALLYAVHPTRVEAVAWIAARKDVLCGFFAALTLLAWAHYRTRPSTARYLAFAAAMTLALASKPAAIVLPFALAVASLHWPWKVSLGTLVRELSPAGLAAAAVAVINLGAEHRLGGLSTTTHLTLGDRVWGVPLNLAMAMRSTLFPSGLHLAYERPEVDARGLVLAFMLIGGVSVGAYLARKPTPSLAIGLAWFTLLLLPTVGLLQVVVQFSADRYLTLPHLLLLPAVVAAVSNLARGKRRTLASMVLGVTLLALSTASLAQAATWRDTESVGEQALSVDPNNRFVAFALGQSRLKNGNIEGAVQMFARVLETHPADGSARSILAMTLAQHGRIAQAEQVLAEAPQSARGDPFFLHGSGVVAMAAGRFAEAVETLRLVVAMNLPWLDVHADYARALSQAGLVSEAAVQWEQVTQSAPRNVEGWLNLGVSYARLERFAAAAAAFERALTLSPGNERAAQLLRHVRAELEKGAGRDAP